MTTGPPIARPRTLAGGGTSARAISWEKIACSISVAPRPPYSDGQEMPAQPASCSWRCQSRRKLTTASRPSPSGSEPGSFCSSQARSSSRNCSSEGESVRSIGRGAYISWPPGQTADPDPRRSSGTARGATWAPLAQTPNAAKDQPPPPAQAVRPYALDSWFAFLNGSPLRNACGLLLTLSRAACASLVIWLTVALSPAGAPSAFTPSICAWMSEEAWAVNCFTWAEVGFLFLGKVWLAIWL